MLNTEDWIETERTRMRPFEEADAEQAFVWLSDPEVMRFIPRGADATVEDTRGRIASYREHQARFGFSKRLILERASGQPIGDCGLFHMPDGKRVELGYRLVRSQWGRGLATEIGRAWLQWFYAHFPDEPLFADAHAENLSSRRVLAKLGFVATHSELIFDLPMLIYRHHRKSGPGVNF